MKMKYAASASVLALGLGLAGCVQEEEDFVPRRQAGFRPPTSAVYSDPVSSVDPAPAPLSPLPDPAPLSQQTPQQSGFQPPQNLPTPVQPPPQSAPLPPPSVESAPAPAPAPKQSPQYAKRVPGKPNQIYNPYTGAILDVTGLTPGTEVRDPRTGETMLVP